MIFTATAVLQYDNLDRATAGLSAELRRQLLAADVHEMPQWETCEVTGPIELADLRGRTCEYPATVESRRPFGPTTTVTPRRDVPTGSG